MKTASEETSRYVNAMEFRSCYPSGKRAAKTLCVAYAKSYSGSRAASQFIKQAYLKKDIIMKSSGLQQRSYCYAADCISAILFILLKG